MKLSPGKGGDEGEETREEGAGSTLESICRGLDEGHGGTGVMMLRTTEVENNQTGRLMVNLGKDKVAMYEAPTFPKGGNRPGFPSRERPWLLDSEDIAIRNKPENKET